MNDSQFTAEGTVGQGKGWGHKIGFPTANIPCTNSNRSGTYAGRVAILGDTMIYNAAIYVDTKRNLLESHILDFDRDIYGKTITVTLLEKIAPSQVFQNESALKEFISQAVSDVRIFFKSIE